ncbi:MAG: hypothetical protein RLZZ543_342 [Bacteroidota bacterium]|jgi:predicted enzyme related to lactoylglutathione lyase
MDRFVAICSAFFMQQRLSFITLGVNDFEGMKRFYTEVFGWKIMNANDGIVFFHLNGFIFGLYPAHALAEDVGVKNDGQGFKQSSMAINFNSKEKVDAVFTELISKGATSIKQPEEVFWGGYRGYIADPENNYWEIAWNPFLEMDEQGNVLRHP